MESRAVWKSEFEVGIEDIDAQHRYFMALIRKVETLVNDPARREREERLLLEIVRYARYHFACEEKLMELYEYPELEKHREEHLRLFAKLEAFLQEKGGEALRVARVMAFLYSWFAGHTTLDDQEYAAYVKGVRRAVDPT